VENGQGTMVVVERQLFGKRRIMEKLKYFTMSKYNLPKKKKKSSKRKTKILQDIIISL
jgi:hypothetical protein